MADPYTYSQQSVVSTLRKKQAFSKANPTAAWPLFMSPTEYNQPMRHPQTIATLTAALMRHGFRVVYAFNYSLLDGEGNIDLMYGRVLMKKLGPKEQLNSEHVGLQEPHYPKYDGVAVWAEKEELPELGGGAAATAPPAPQ